MKVLLKVIAKGIIEVEMDDEVQLEEAQEDLSSGPVDLDTFASRNSIEITNEDLQNSMVFEVVSAKTVQPEGEENK